MAYQEVVYVQSYLRGFEVVNGNFPVTKNGYVDCSISDRIKATNLRKKQILSEQIDISEERIQQYLIGFDDTIIGTFDDSVILYI
jgi:hypothetical protein